MRRNIITGILIFVAFVLQSTLIQAVSLGGISPDIMMILTVSYGFIRGKKNGLVTGFCSGILVDIFFGNVLGFYALVYMYIGYLNGLLHETFFKEDIKLPLILVSISNLSYNIIIYILMFLLRRRLNPGIYFVRIIIPEMIYTVLLMLLIYPLILKINKKFDQIEKRSAKKFV